MHRRDVRRNILEKCPIGIGVCAAVYHNRAIDVEKALQGKKLFPPQDGRNGYYVARNKVVYSLGINDFMLC